MDELEELSYSECEALLRAGVAGRIAVVDDTGPHIVPVNYSIVDGAIVVLTAPASVVGRHAPGAQVAFEVDQVDYGYQRGWSVQARGRCEVVDEVDRLNQIERVWPPRPWAGGDRTLFLRLYWAELTGRRIGHGWNVFSDLPGRRVV
jgi:nitroimidazol reductase NimA-like FMN-containing flavoprotein (pyridoxamine 5'-phosphate oxidase superfamily)